MNRRKDKDITQIIVAGQLRLVAEAEHADAMLICRICLMQTRFNS